MSDEQMRLRSRQVQFGGPAHIVASKGPSLPTLYGLTTPPRPFVSLPVTRHS